jgi:hypothetical protein
MNGFDVAIKEIQAATAELKESNDYAEFVAEERAKLQRQIDANTALYSHAPRLARDLINDKVAVYVGDKKAA